jgi:hypothetical protein
VAITLILSLLLALLLGISNYREDRKKWETTLHEHLAYWDLPRGRLRLIGEVSLMNSGSPSLSNSKALPASRDANMFGGYQTTT